MAIAPEMLGEPETLDEIVRDQTESGPHEASPDHRRFNEIYDQFGNSLFGYIYSNVGPNDAPDVFQETLLGILSSLDRYDPAKGSIENWVFRIARNKVFDTLRITYRDRVIDYDADLEKANAGKDRGTSNDPAEIVMSTEGLNGWLKILKSLPEEQLKALRPSLIDLSQSEIADELDLPLGTVKTRQRRALKRSGNLALVAARKGELDLSPDQGTLATKAASLKLKY